MEKIAAQGEYLLKLMDDEIPLNPRTDYDNFGRMVCFHPRYSLGDEHSYHDSDDFLLDLLSETLGSEEKAEQFRQRLVDRLDPKEIGWAAFDQAVDGRMLQEIGKKHVVLPLYLYDHSGITMNTSGFACPWDSGVVGWIYAGKDAVLNEFGGKLLTKTKREQAEKLLVAEVETYDYYLRGDSYRYELYQNGEEIDSCSGFLGDMKDVLADLKSHLPDECEDMVEMLEPAPPPRQHSIAELMEWAKEQRKSLVGKPSVSTRVEAR